MASILVVDDDPAVLGLVSHMLKQSGFGVFAAAGPSQALAVYGRHAGEIGMVICDVVMPEVSGPELVERFFRQSPPVPVLFISGYSDTELLDGRLDGHSAALLEKPFTPSALISRTRKMLESWHSASAAD